MSQKIFLIVNEIMWHFFQLQKNYHTENLWNINSKKYYAECPTIILV